jgi:hypothetical protein
VVEERDRAAVVAERLQRADEVAELVVGVLLQDGGGAEDVDDEEARRTRSTSSRTVRIQAGSARLRPARLVDDVEVVEVGVPCRVEAVAAGEAADAAADGGAVAFERE